MLNIEGYYYQASVMGENVTWLVGHDRGIGSLGDVDMPVMTTFVQFYTTMLKFTNFRLYKALGIHYPPALATSEAIGNAAEEGERRILPIKTNSCVCRRRRERGECRRQSLQPLKAAHTRQQRGAHRDDRHVRKRRIRRDVGSSATRVGGAAHALQQLLLFPRPRGAKRAARVCNSERRRLSLVGRLSSANIRRAERNRDACYHGSSAHKSRHYKVRKQAKIVVNFAIVFLLAELFCSRNGSSTASMRAANCPSTTTNRAHNCQRICRRLLKSATAITYLWSALSSSKRAEKVGRGLQQKTII